MSLDILAALSDSLKHKDSLSNNNDNHIHPQVFRIALKKLGCDQDTIEDCLFELPEKWEWLLQYFEDKNNETGKT